MTLFLLFGKWHRPCNSQNAGSERPHQGTYAGSIYSSGSGNLHSSPENAPPSQLALATSVMEFGRCESTSTASAWPSSAAMNGLKNMRSIFAAFSARTRSRARANRCCKGSKFRCVGVAALNLLARQVGCRTDIFCEGVGQVAKTSSAELPPSRSSQLCSSVEGHSNRGAGLWKLGKSQR